MIEKQEIYKNSAFIPRYDQFIKRNLVIVTRLKEIKKQYSSKWI